jgi:hypothetical protein
MVRDKEHGELTDAELAAVAGGKQIKSADRLEAEAEQRTYISSKGGGGAYTLLLD